MGIHFLQRNIMKNILIILLLAGLSFACSPTYENSVEKLTVDESSYILDHPKDTIIVARIVEDNLYEIEDGKVKKKRHSVYY